MFAPTPLSIEEKQLSAKIDCLWTSAIHILYPFLLSVETDELFGFWTKSLDVKCIYLIAYYEHTQTGNSRVFQQLKKTSGQFDPQDEKRTPFVLLHWALVFNVFYSFFSPCPDMPTVFIVLADESLTDYWRGMPQSVWRRRLEHKTFVYRWPMRGPFQLMKDGSALAKLNEEIFSLASSTERSAGCWSPRPYNNEDRSLQEVWSLNWRLKIHIWTMG